MERYDDSPAVWLLLIVLCLIFGWIGILWLAGIVAFIWFIGLSGHCPQIYKRQYLSGKVRK